MKFVFDYVFPLDNRILIPPTDIDTHYNVVDVNYMV